MEPMRRGSRGAEVEVAVEADRRPALRVEAAAVLSPRAELPMLRQLTLQWVLLIKVSFLAIKCKSIAFRSTRT